jgi:uncharacterized protein (DUF305 family)
MEEQMKRNSLALGSASILILAGVTLGTPAMAQSQTQPQDQSQMQDKSQANQAQDEAPAKAKVMHHRRAMSQNAKQTAKEDRSEDRVTAQLNQQQLAQAGNQSGGQNGMMSNGTMTNTGDQPSSMQNGAQGTVDNPQTNNCVAAGSGVNCSTPTPNANVNGGTPPGPSK